MYYFLRKSIYLKGFEMETEVLMKRDFMGGEVRQKSKSSFLSATDLISIGNEWRRSNGLNDFNLSQWFETKNNKEFISQMEKQFGVCVMKGRGRSSITWVHPYIFLDLALSLNPQFKIEVYGWIQDNLLKYRNDSGDSYKKMTGALWLSIENKSKFKDELVYIANRIKIECDVTDWNEATEQQLKLRDKIHEYIALLSDIIRERENLIDVSVKRAKEKMEDD
jgi:hypothetical protein